MKDVWIRCIVLILTDIVESARRTVISIADYHLVFHDESTYLPSLAITVLRPYLRHSEVTAVEGLLFLLFLVHRFLSFLLWIVAFGEFFLHFDQVEVYRLGDGFRLGTGLLLRTLDAIPFKQGVDCRLPTPETLI